MHDSELPGRAGLPSSRRAARQAAAPAGARRAAAAIAAPTRCWPGAAEERAASGAAISAVHLVSCRCAVCGCASEEEEGERQSSVQTPSPRSLAEGEHT